MTIKETLSNIFSNYQNLPLFPELTNCNKSNSQKKLKCLIKNDCVYHKHWYEPVNNDNNEPRHIQIDRCTFGLLAKGGCKTECKSYIPLNHKNNGI